MPMETRSFDDPVLVTAVGRYTPAERSGLIAGDLVLTFGPHKSSALKEDPDLVQRIGGKDWLTILRGEIYFKLQARDGLAGASFEATTPLDNVSIPAEGPSWFTCSCGMQADGTTLLIPEKISPLWTFLPVILYTRFRLWQMLTGAVLVYCLSAVMGFEAFLLAYFVSSLPVLTSGAYLMRSASEKQGYAKRGDVMVASWSDAAALEIQTAKRIYAARHPAPVPKVEPVMDAAA